MYMTLLCVIRLTGSVDSGYALVYRKLLDILRSIKRFFICVEMVTQPVFHQQVYHGIFTEIEYRIVTMYQYQLKNMRQTKQIEFKTLQTKHNVLKTL